MTGRALPTGRPVAVVVARAGAPPVGADETVAEAGGAVLVVGDGAAAAARRLRAAERAWLADTGPGLRVGALARALAAVLHEVPLVLLPASPDGRDLAPRLAATLDRPLLAGAVRVSAGEVIRADLQRLDGRLDVPVRCPAPVVATLLPGSRSAAPVRPAAPPVRLTLPQPSRNGPDVEVLGVDDPDPATVDLAEAGRLVGAGGGLVPPGTPEPRARATIALLAAVADRLRAATGGTRVVTDAGWLDHQRQIGSTGVIASPGLYLAFGVSGASQHVVGLGHPRHVLSVNTDPACPMTAMADLGVVADAAGTLVALAHRLGVEVPGDAGDG